MAEMKHEDAAPGVDKKKQEESWWSVLLWALVIALIFRTFIFQPFKIPTKSMMENLLVGDYLLVSKMSYGFSHHSLPFSPKLFSGRIFESPVERGDVVVFRLPRDPDIYFIKRIIGLPGDTIQMRKSRLYLNGMLVEREPVGDFKIVNGNGQEESFPKYRETLPGGKSYITLDLGWNASGRADDTTVFLVPKGHYFAMGDNRDNSLDSRWPKKEGVGYVPSENIVGQAKVIWISFDENAKLWEFWKWFPKQRLKRMFTGIQ